mmetsp:Transcript_113294/g.360112  ORF Transcript_113294/g.360112 Transcript_113294/m.360112 type:complete len:225 (+) Transcript_113294:1465-2139(+)
MSGSLACVIDAGHEGRGHPVANRPPARCRGVAGAPQADDVGEAHALLRGLLHSFYFANRVKRCIRRDQPSTGIPHGHCRRNLHLLCVHRGRYDPHLALRAGGSGRRRHVAQRVSNFRRHEWCRHPHPAGSHRIRGSNFNLLHNRWCSVHQHPHRGAGRRIRIDKERRSDPVARGSAAGQRHLLLHHLAGELHGATLLRILVHKSRRLPLAHGPGSPITCQARRL